MAWRSCGFTGWLRVLSNTVLTAWQRRSVLTAQAGSHDFGVIVIVTGVFSRSKITIGSVEENGPMAIES